MSNLNDCYDLILNGQDSSLNTEIWTNFRRSIVDFSGPLHFTEEPSINYKPYDVFCLKTRLSAWLVRNLDPTYYPNFVGKERNFEMVQAIEIKSGDKIVSLNSYQRKNIQKEVNRILADPSKAALVISFDQITQFSPGWVKSMLPYMGISRALNPRLEDQGILAEFSSTSTNLVQQFSTPQFSTENLVDYYSVRTSLILNIMDRLEYFAKKGAIINPPKEIIEKWELIKVGSDNLYLVSWEDPRISDNLVLFLEERVQGKKTVDFYVGRNLVDRHRIIDILEKRFPDSFPNFSSSYLRVKVENLRDAQEIATIVENLIRSSSGKVLTISCRNSPELEEYLSSAVEKIPNGRSAIGYVVNNHKNPYVMSVPIEYEDSIQDLSIMLQINVISNRRNKSLE